jgi:hypothetical protein
MKRDLMRCALIVFLALFVVATLTADTLVLRDGRRVEGRLISVRNGVADFEEGRFGGGRVVRFDRDDIRNIEFDRNERNVRNEPTYPQQPTFQGGRPSGLRERSVMVPANVQWIDTNIEVKSGQAVFFEANGEVRWGGNRRAGPAGEQNSPMNPNRPMPNRPGAALIGRVGNTADYFFIGSDTGPIRMRSSGRLFLGLNDDVLEDNTGYLRVIVYY